MTTHAIGTLDPMAAAANVFTAAPPRAVPSRGALHAELRAQRLRLVAVFSLGLAIAGTVWGLGQGLVALGEGESERTRCAVSLLQSVILAAGGLVGVYCCRLRGLRRATYSNVAALILSATINLAFIRNAEGAAVVAYARRRRPCRLGDAGTRMAVVGRHPPASAR